MLTLAFSLKHCGAYVQPHRADSMTEVLHEKLARNVELIRKLVEKKQSKLII